MSDQLRITEIFYSLQGEAKTSGRPTVFVRLTGCPLRCGYCDTEYAFSGGTLQLFDEIIAEVNSHPTSLVTVTGGEPLAQPQCLALLSRLCDQGKKVSLETSGALDISGVDQRVSVVMDLKTPDSTEVSKNLYGNIEFLKPVDQVKFVVCSRRDYDWARLQLDQYRLCERVEEVLFSPAFELLSPTDLAEWILKDGLNVRMQIQLHKILWGDKPGV